VQMPGRGAQLKSVFWLVVVCAAVALIPGAAGAALSQLGPTGVVGTPTAEITPQGMYDVALDFVNRDVMGDKVKEWPLRLAAGVSERAELGASYLQFRDGESLRLLGLTGKVLLSRETESAPAIAVGIVYGTSHDLDYGVVIPSMSGTAGDLDVTTFYLVATKTLTMRQSDFENYGDTQPTGNAVRGSVGVMYDRYRFKGSGFDFDQDDTEPFLSLELVSPKGTTLAAEYKLKEKDVSTDAISSVVLRHEFTPGFQAELGLTNALHTLAGEDHAFFVGIQYRWGVVERTSML
jgi:hypothetical protein